MKPRTDRAWVFRETGRILKGLYGIWVTRDTYGYNSTLERFFRYLTGRMARPEKGTPPAGRAAGRGVVPARDLGPGGFVGGGS